MTSRLLRHAVPAIAVLSLLGAGSADASALHHGRHHRTMPRHGRHHRIMPRHGRHHRIKTRPGRRHVIMPRPGHHHDIMPTPVTGTEPGLQPVPLQLPAPSYVARTDAQLHAALQAARPGQVIQLASGASFSPIFDDTVRGGYVTISGAGDAVQPTIAGANLEGSTYLRFTNVRFSDRVFIGKNPVRPQPAANIQLLNDDVNCGATETGGNHNPVETTSKTTGIVVRQAAQNVAIEGDWIHDCTLGLATVASDNPTQNLVIAHNLMEDFFGDAMDIGGNVNTLIAYNIIQDIHHSPGVVYHDDGIQFLGNTQGTTIENNVLDNSGDQLIFIQDAIANKYTGYRSNSNILVQGNLLYGTGAFAINDEGGLNTRFISNTVWDAHDGAIAIRRSPMTGIVPPDTVVVRNVFSNYCTLGGAKPEIEQDNMITWIATGHRSQMSPTDILGVEPDFVDPSTGDFALVPGSPGSGTLSGTTATSATGTPINLSQPLAGTAAMTLGANPANLPYGAPVFGLTGSAN